MSDSNFYSGRQSYPDNQRVPRYLLQLLLRVIAVLGVLGGVPFSVLLAAQQPSFEAPWVFAQSCGGILSACLMLWIAAAIVDALRVIAANSFKDVLP